MLNRYKENRLRQKEKYLSLVTKYNIEHLFFFFRVKANFRAYCPYDDTSLRNKFNVLTKQGYVVTQLVGELCY